MDGLRISLLDTVSVSRGDVVLPVSGSRLQSLLARLAIAGGRPVEQSTLVDAIWAEEPPADPAHALQTLVSRLRRALGSAEVVVQVAGGYRLDVVPDDVDALRFERLAASGHPDALVEAVALWTDRSGSEPTAITAVAPSVATRLARISIDVVVDLAEAELTTGCADAATSRLSDLLAEHPAHEQAAVVLMDAFAAQGRQAEALALYERVRETLADTLGADPGAALRERHLRALRLEPAALAPGTAPATGNLPASLTSFIGRVDELARIEASLASGRLVTVLGPGGAGKTRLALEAARRQEHRDGTWLIDLSVVSEPSGVVAAFLAGSGLRSGADGRDDLDFLVAQLSGRTCLLVIDNCEHLIDSAAHTISILLTRCAQLRVLATSREPLAVDGESLVPLGPLSLPESDADLERARGTASVRLFAERAAAVLPGFAVDSDTLDDVLRVVLGLDGMPLALELAAARLRTLSLPELATGLSDRFRVLTSGSRTARPRHRTLRAVIAWSWDLLSEPERTLADRLSVLPGGVTADSAEAVCAGAVADVPELLAGLVDRSLLQLAPEPGRYRMLETLREYGINRLTETGELDAVRGLAADHFAGLMARNDQRLRGPDQLAAIRLVNAEYDNTLAALRHRCAAGDATGAIALALDLTWYWQMFGHHPDAAHRLGEALAVPGGALGPERDCARAIYLLNRADADDDDRAALADRLRVYPDLPAPHRVLSALLLLSLRNERSAFAVLEGLARDDEVWSAGLARLLAAQLAAATGELDRVRTTVAAALTCFRQAGDRWGQAAALSVRAQVRQHDDDLDGAQADLLAARVMTDEFGSHNRGNDVYGELRWIDLHLRRGETDLAIARIESIRQRTPVASAPRLTGSRVRLGDLERARELVDDGAASAVSPARALVGSTRAALCLELGDVSGAETALAEAYAVALEAGDLPVLSVVTLNAATVAGAHGQQHEAAVLHQAAARLLRAASRRARKFLE
ncbi:BTAD domain-containing putative transcriptional regulator [Cryptosporangium sp. NPDC051539]|uniref:BTAD domain-containing putative transcriptional regulator n=1 Tax=Cryptosporangium sp. NPDC051539 TaxID=3363962 RepID=UPI00379AF2D7